MYFFYHIYIYIQRLVNLNCMFVFHKRQLNNYLTIISLLIGLLMKLSSKKWHFTDTIPIFNTIC